MPEKALLALVRVYYPEAPSSAPGTQYPAAIGGFPCMFVAANMKSLVVPRLVDIPKPLESAEELETSEDQEDWKFEKNVHSMRFLF
jgi:hypothetical protein